MRRRAKPASRGPVDNFGDKLGTVWKAGSQELTGIKCALFGAALCAKTQYIVFPKI